MCCWGPRPRFYRLDPGGLAGARLPGILPGRIMDAIGEQRAGSLEISARLQHVAEMLVPQFADHCRPVPHRRDREPGRGRDRPRDNRLGTSARPRLPRINRARNTLAIAAR